MGSKWWESRLTPPSLFWILLICIYMSRDNKLLIILGYILIILDIVRAKHISDFIDVFASIYRQGSTSLSPLVFPRWACAGPLATVVLLQCYLPLTVLKPHTHPHTHTHTHTHVCIKVVHSTVRTALVSTTQGVRYVFLSSSSATQLTDQSKWERWWLNSDAWQCFVVLCGTLSSFFPPTPNQRFPQIHLNLSPVN